MNEDISVKGMESLRELYKIGYGPSSSHTMGPERAARLFKEKHPTADKFVVTLYGSLALTGVGHRTDYIVEKTLQPAEVEIIFDPVTLDLPHPNTMDIVAFRGEEKLGEWRVLSVCGGDFHRAPFGPYLRPY